VTYGAEGFNIVNSIAGAYAERSPVVASAPGARERTSGFLLHHQTRTVDTQLAVFREITCDQAVLTDLITGTCADRAGVAQRPGLSRISL
jgi:indolepyruvate decarboxylase